MFLRGVLVVFDIMNAPRIHKGSYVLIFTSLPSWKVVQLLGEGGDKQNVTDRQTECSFIYIDCTNRTFTRFT